MVEDVVKNMIEIKKIPQAEYEAYVKLEGEAESVWEEARKNLISKLFRRTLEKNCWNLKRNLYILGYENI